MDKAIEHNTKVFLLSVDLQKPYDSIPGVIIDLVRALHDNMVAEFFVADESAWIQVSNGLRQGCVLAPTLFLLYFNMVR